MTQRNVNLKAIRIDGGTQARVEINLATVAEYAELVKDGTDLPPVVLFNDGTDLWIGDGFHRFFGYRDADRASIPADVRTGTLRDAVRYSLSANNRHGLRPTIADKRKAVAAMLADPEWSQMSDRAIAKELDVSNTFVSNTRNPKPVAPKEPEAPVNVDTPKPPKQPPTTGGGTITGGSAQPPKVEDSSTPTPPAAPTPAPPTEAERQAAMAHGDDDVLALLEETQRELVQAQAQLQAAEADDLKAEAMKWHRLAEVAQRRQNEMQARVNEREAELLKLTNTLRRIAKAVDESDPTKVAAAVEALVRKVKAVA